MKTKTLAFIATMFIVASGIIGISGCRKEHCYDCEKNAATQVDYSYVMAIGEDDKNYWESQGYTCTDNGKKMKKKKK